jgi:ATP-binding cassette subfamily C (CFTR/MRP) protein 4
MCYFLLVTCLIAKAICNIAIENIIANMGTSNKDEAYKWAGILVALNFVYLLTNHHCWDLMNHLGVKLRLCIINVLYHKITDLSSNTGNFSNSNQFYKI